LKSLLGLVLILLCAVPGPVQAQTSAGSAAAPDWDGPLPSEAVNAIFTPANGALIVGTSDGLERSDDGGQSFYYPRSSPHISANFMTVDPTDQDVWYATGGGDALVYQGTYGGLTWRPILTNSSVSGVSLASPSLSNPDFHVARFMVSPADSSVLYAAVVDRARHSFVLLGSRDRGASWTTLHTSGPVSCSYGVYLLQGHPTNASRIFLSFACGGGGTFSSSLQQSTDQGKTFQDLWKSDKDGAPLSGYPRSLVGGRGAAPSRWYLAFNRDSRIGGSVVLRSDDDGTAWAPILSFDGGGTFASESPGTDLNKWNIRIAGLADDPSAPDTLYVARTAIDPYTGQDTQPVLTSGVTMTTDGGVTWSDLGSQQLGQLNDLALGIDGKNLYAASDKGLFRLQLPASAN
jgi:photosystem II stability/assembly factor-like uncharacterized protein